VFIDHPRNDRRRSRIGDVASRRLDPAPTVVELHPCST
jgi:hypothetical protein